MSQVFLAFHICDEIFGINVMNVLEVLDKQAITEIPNAPEYIKGIINFRGEVVPVMDTRKRLNLDERDENEPFVIAVLDLVQNNEPFRMGIMVDKLNDVITIQDKDILPVPAMGSKFRPETLTGIVQYDNRFILLLDLQKIFMEEVVV